MAQREHVLDIAADRDGTVDQPAASALLIGAMAEGSNLELEWLWLFTRVTREEERRYCLERARYINPHSDMARHELAKLNAMHRAPMVEKHAARIGARLIAALLVALAVVLWVMAAAGAIA